MQVVHQQLRGSHECSQLFILHVFLACIVSFQITKPGRVVNTVKIFSWVSETTKIFLHEILKKQKFYNTKISSSKFKVNSTHVNNSILIIIAAHVQMHWTVFHHRKPCTISSYFPSPPILPSPLLPPFLFFSLFFSLFFPLYSFLPSLIPSPLSTLSSLLLCPSFSLSRQLNLLNTHKVSQLTWGAQHGYTANVTQLGSSDGSTIYWMALCGAFTGMNHIGKACSGHVSWVCVNHVWAKQVSYYAGTLRLTGAMGTCWLLWWSSSMLESTDAGLELLPRAA